MNDLAPAADITVPADVLASILQVYDDGLYLQAYQRAQAVGPLPKWRGSEARILAGRLAGNLGSIRFADWHFVHAWRKDRTHPETLWYFARYLLSVRGPLAAWKFVQDHPFPRDAARTMQSHWFSQHATILGRLRDFDAAEVWLHKADALGEEAWTCLEWAALYTLEDRHADAEKAARRALQLHPWYRPAVQWVAHFLVQQQRDDEALQLLTQATGFLESGAVFAQLANLQMELKRYDDAGHSLDEVERLSPLADRHMKQWLDARRCDLACFRGDFDKAIEHGRKAVGTDARTKSKFYESLVPLLTNRTGPGKRVEVPVAFVQQHHRTCAPATLVAIAKFWTMPADHLEVAAEISYAGTPHHSQRKWAHDHGWLTKEFTVDWDTAVALIERGIPFTLTTTEVTTAHLQAVVGYDSLRRTLIIRDPGERHRVEMAYDVMLERYRSTGPRGMAMVPIAQKEKLAALTLPDEALYEILFQVERALKDHRREEARLGVEALAGQAPKHFLTATAQRILAIYDADMPAELTHTERLLELFPGDTHLELARAYLLSVLGRYQQRVEILKGLAGRKEADPACWQQYAWELSADARRHPQALYLLRKAARVQPMLARTYTTLARIRVTQRRFDEALQLYHFAVCLEEKDEYVAQDYFMEARGQGKTDEAMTFLQKRFDRLGAFSSQPARTLYFAYVQQGRYDDAFNALERALALRPDDGDLLTYAAEAHTNLGDFARAQELLDQADGVSKPAARWRSLAYLAWRQGDLARACECWQEVLKIEPIAEDAHRNYCTLSADREGREAAVAHLKAACKRFPNHFGLNKQLYDWLLEDGPAARDGVIQGLLAIHPASVDTHIEYAYNLADQDRFADALEHLDAAETLDPTNAKLWFARGALHKRKRQFEEAKFAFREAVRHSVDFEPAIQELIWLCENIGERREVLSFIGAELLRQTTFGNGIVTLVVNMQYGIPPRELLGHVKRIRDAKPNLWIAWQCVCRQAGFAELMSERTEAAQENVRRFPSIAELWLDLAEVQRVLNDTDAEQRSLQRAIELAPNYPHAVRMLVQACERADQKDDAKKACTQAIRRTPLAGAPYIEYADLLFRRQEYDEAIKQAAKGIALDPWHDESWNIVSNWCVQLDRVKDLVDMARSLTKKQPGNWRSWLRLALALQARSWFWLSAGVQVQTACANQDEEDARIDECIAAYDEAIKRNPAGYDVFDPRNPVPRDLHDSKAEMLANAGRYDDAAKACNPPAFKGKPPVNLRGRAAWVSAMKGDYEIAKQQMAKVLREDKAYQWGWDRMFDWGYATNDFKAVHDAANDLLRANPQSALAVAMRGEALVRMDEKDAALNDLRAAHRKDPCLQRAVFALFDQQIADEDLVGAEATLRSMEEHLFEGLIEGRRIQFHAAKANQAEALRLYKDLCVSPFPVPPALDTATRAVDLAGWKAEADVIIKDAMKEPNANLHLALLYATGWNPNQANDLPDRIAAIDQALAKLPGNFRFLDLKAELLSNGTQFERAWQTCKEKTFPIDQFALDGRGVWVMFRAGQRTEAIFAMRDLVKKHPKYYWGWMQLADWYGQQQKWVDVLTVAEQLVVINPRDPVGFGYRGQAKENLNDVQAARADYIHSIDLQPNYMFGVWQLFNVYVRAGEWQRAEKLLDKAKKHAEPADWALRRVDLLIYQNKKGPFAAEFENLCKKSAKSPWVIDQSLMFVVQAGWWSEAEEVLHRCLDLGPHICDPWVRLRVAMGDRNVGEDVQQMNSSRPERTNCIAAYAIELAYAKDPGGLRRWILTHEDDLRADTPCWAKVGFALSVIQDWAGIIEWMSDWTDHPKALPGMLLPLIRAHRSLREVDDARKVSLHALTKLNPDFAASFHKVWLMFDSAMKGETLPVQRYLDGSDLGGFDGYHQMIAAMVRAWWLTATDKQTGFARARKVLADAATFAPPIIPDPALTKAYQQCVAELADLRGTFGAKLWRWWRWLMPKLPAVQKTN